MSERYFWGRGGHVPPLLRRLLRLLRLWHSRYMYTCSSDATCKWHTMVSLVLVLVHTWYLSLRWLRFANTTDWPSCTLCTEDDNQFPRRCRKTPESRVRENHQLQFFKHSETALLVAFMFRIYLTLNLHLPYFIFFYIFVVGVDPCLNFKKSSF